MKKTSADNEQPLLMTIEQTMARTSLCRNTIKKWIREEGLPVIYFTKRIVRIPAAEFEQWYQAKIERTTVGTVGTFVGTSRSQDVSEGVTPHLQVVEKSRGDKS